MKVVLLAGGTGTRLSEETIIRPKPMVEIGGNPILWHIMKLYSAYGFNDFVICLGYKGYMIKEYFINYFYHQSDLTINLKENKITVHSNNSDPWIVTLVDTGIESLTGGRIKRIKNYIDNKTFMLTYGDGVSDINIKNLYASHKKSKKIATLTAVQPMGRFGTVEIANGIVSKFKEKPQGNEDWINAGFFVLEPEIFDFIENDQSIWEKEPLENIANKNQLNAYKHEGFWKPMDTLRDKTELQHLWDSNQAPWKVWHN